MLELRSVLRWWLRIPLAFIITILSLSVVIDASVACLAPLLTSRYPDMFWYSSTVTQPEITPMTWSSYSVLWLSLGLLWWRFFRPPFGVFTWAVIFWMGLFGLTLIWRVDSPEEMRTQNHNIMSFVVCVLFICCIWLAQSALWLQNRKVKQPNCGN